MGIINASTAEPASEHGYVSAKLQIGSRTTAHPLNTRDVSYGPGQFRAAGTVVNRSSRDARVALVRVVFFSKNNDILGFVLGATTAGVPAGREGPFLAAYGGVPLDYQSLIASTKIIAVDPDP